MSVNSNPISDLGFFEPGPFLQKEKEKEQKQKRVFPSIFVLFIPTDQATQRFLDRNQLREETKRYGTRLALFGGASDSFYFSRKLEKQEAPQNRSQGCTLY
jgi:hypothetical protein